MFSKPVCSSLQHSQRHFRSSGRGSSQPRGSSFCFFLPRSTSCCSRSLPTQMTGPASSSGSYTEFTTDNTPLLVNDLSVGDTLNVKVSSCMFHCNPSVLWTGSVSGCKSRSRKSLARSSAGNASITAVEFDATLFSRRLASSVVVR